MCRYTCFSLLLSCVCSGLYVAGLFFKMMLFHGNKVTLPIIPILYTFTRESFPGLDTHNIYKYPINNFRLQEKVLVSLESNSNKHLVGDQRKITKIIKE